MPHEGAPGELARARLDLPVSRRSRTAPTPPLRAVEATIHAGDGGSLMVTLHAEPASGAWTLPLLAWLQFLSRVEDAAAEVLTSSIAGTLNS
jgi:hypothetical protein